MSNYQCNIVVQFNWSNNVVNWSWASVMHVGQKNFIKFQWNTGIFDNVLQWVTKFYAYAVS